jgi:hypothetical protein
MLRQPSLDVDLLAFLGVHQSNVGGGFAAEDVGDDDEVAGAGYVVGEKAVVDEFEAEGIGEVENGEVGGFVWGFADVGFDCG